MQQGGQQTYARLESSNVMECGELSTVFGDRSKWRSIDVATTSGLIPILSDNRVILIISFHLHPDNVPYRSSSDIDFAIDDAISRI